MTNPFPSSIQLVFVDRDTPAWARVWALLQADTGGDIAQPCGCCGEVWQYMGTVIEGTRTTHEFRHRHSPITTNREYRQFREAR